MLPVGRILKALANRSPRDIAHRAGQIARSKLEFHGLGDPAEASVDTLLAILRKGGIDGPDDLLAAFRTRVRERSLPAFRNRQATVATLRKQWPTLASQKRARAQRVADGRFDLLGFEGLSFGQPVDWSLDPVNNKRAPSIHWTKVPYLDPTQVGDHKIVWELNRHQFLLQLGQAAWLTDDERWDDVVVDYVEAWMEANPPKTGINWTSSLEVAFRSISWLWALHFLADSPRLTPARFAQIVAHLRAHGRHVEQYISTSFSPNTHLTGEALALVYLGSMLPELPEAPRWRQRGRDWLLGALDFHINPDGGYFEQSLHYHQYTADFYTHLVLLYRWFENKVPAGLEQKLELVVDHLLGVMRADGTTPLVGDDDGGRLLFLDDRATYDVRSTIQAAAVVLDHAPWTAHVGRPTEALAWLLGPDAVEAYTSLSAKLHGEAAPALASRSFPDTGLHVMRSETVPDEDFTLIRCGPVSGFTGAHSHADVLAVDVTMGGQALLLDPGTASYMNHEQRERFRSSSAHNTVTIDGRSSSESSNPFGWATRATGRLEQWVTRNEYDYFAGSHDGFERFGEGTRHRREVLYVRDGYWIINDRISFGPSAEGSAIAHFQFAPDLTVSLNNDGSLQVARKEGSIANITALSPSTWEEGVGAVAPVYGRIIPAPAWALRAADNNRSGRTAQLVTVVTRAAVPVVPWEEGSNTAFSIGGDLLVLSPSDPSGSVSDQGASYDLAWGRTEEGGGFSAVFAADGTQVAPEDHARTMLRRWAQKDRP